MADTALSDKYNIFIKKIGVSVGLEKAIDRLVDFSLTYASHPAIGEADILEMIKGWGLKDRKLHVLDFYRSADVLSLKNGDVNFLEVGEALGILAHLYGNDKLTLHNVTRILFCATIILNDGDIFLNALISEFDPSRFSSLIGAMIEEKWSVLEPVFRTAFARQQIYKFVNIAVQPTNPGSRGRTSSFSSSGPGPLADLPRGGPLLADPVARNQVVRPSIPDLKEYCRKVLPTRKGWAVSLGLATESGHLTERGVAFLDYLGKIGFGGHSGCMHVWPLRHEMTGARWGDIELPQMLDSWDFHQTIFSAFCDGEISQWNDQIHEEGISLLKRMFGCFHQLNQRKMMLRSQLPIRIAYRVGLGMAVAESRPLPPYREIVSREQGRYHPRVLARRSEQAEFSLAFS